MRFKDELPDLLSEIGQKVSEAILQPILIHEKFCVISHRKHPFFEAIE